METYRCALPHAENVATLALALYDELARLGLQTIDRRERELLWAAAMLHDAGVIVDYNDHHKHGFYLVLNAGLPGFRHWELATDRPAGARRTAGPCPLVGAAR